MNINEFNLNVFDLSNKVAIVTGGNTGLGLAYTIALAKANAKVFVVTHASDVSEAKQLLAENNLEAEFFQANLLDKDASKNIVEGCLKVYGRIDILVNNAGTIRRAPLLEYQDQDWQDVIDINLNAVYYLSQKVAQVMAKQNSGKIINIASMLSFQGGKFVPPYTASKHGVVGITKSFASELSAYNIQVNAIAPGYIKTANTQPIRDDAKRNQEILDRIPVGRWGDVADLMGSIVFLASDASNYVTGHVLAVDGGWLVR